MVPLGTAEYVLIIIRLSEVRYISGVVLFTTLDPKTCSVLIKGVSL